MIHIPGPHLCPACNIVHDLNKDREFSKTLQRGGDLRPFFGSFLQIAGSGSTPAYAYSGDISSGFGGWPTFGTLTFGSQSQSGFNFFANSTTITVPATGQYFIGSQAHENGGHQTAAAIQLVRNGSTGITPTYGHTYGEATISTDPYGAEIGIYCLIQLTAGDSIQMQGSQAWGISAATFLMVFVPTPTYRK